MVMQRIEDWNAAVFLAVNADGSSPQLLLIFARFIAETAPAIVLVALALLWIRQTRLMRLHLLDATLTALVGLISAQVITHLWYHPRPFELGLGHQFMPHVPEASFPSDHATLLFGLAIPLVFGAKTRGVGLIFVAIACATAWARVFLGVHFPFDMAGGLLVACMAALVVTALREPLHTRLYPQLISIYKATLSRLALPVRLFPRDR